MSLWSDPYISSSYSRNEYNEAKNEYNKVNSTIERLKEKGKKKAVEIKNLLGQERKFIGYLAKHNYRADNNAGNTLVGNTLFLIDKEFKNVLFSCEVEEYNQLQENIKEIEERINEEK